MQCTSCKQGTLQPAYLDALFQSHHCSHCEGDFVLIPDYLRWLKQAINDNKEIASQLVTGVETIDEDSINDTQRMILCPITGRMMTKYKISATSSHYLDYSPTVQGIWLDKGEWTLLVANGLADQLHKIFTDHWQLEIRAQESHNMLEKLHREKFGDTDYQKIKEFRSWMNNHEKKADIIAYIAADTTFYR